MTSGELERAHTGGSPPGRQARILRVFVASPSDVQPERERMEDVLRGLNEDALVRERGVRFELWQWERNAVPGFGVIQDLIRPDLEEADVVVAFFWNRFGTVDAEGRSGTASEVLESVERWVASGKPRVLLYFCKRLPPADFGDDDEALKQRVLLNEFRRGLREGLRGSFTSTDDFAANVSRHLRAIVAELPPSDVASRSDPAVPTRPGGDVTSSEAACDLDRYLDHVDSVCGEIKLSGLLSDKSAKSMPLDEVYVSLLATRPDLGARADDDSLSGGDHFRAAADEVGPLNELLNLLAPRTEGEAADLDESTRALVIDCLESVGVPEAEARRPALLSSVIARVHQLAAREDGGRLTAGSVRHVLTTVELEEAVRLGTRLLVEGDPGSGKTTTLMRIAMMLRAASLPGDLAPTDAATRLGFEPGAAPLPVFAPLRRFRAWMAENVGVGTTPRAEHLRDFLVKTEGVFGGGEGRWLERALDEGAVSLLLDGFDEVPDENVRESVAGALRDFIELYPGCRYVVSTRPSGLTDLVPSRLGSLTRCVVQPLDDDRRAAFVRAWYGALVVDREDADKRADDLLRRIRESGIQDLVDTPIMLTTVAIVHQTGGTLPERRAKLYEHCVSALCERWDASKDEFGRALCGPLTLDDKIGLLEEVAHAIHGQGAGESSIDWGDLLELARDHVDLRAWSDPSASGAAVPTRRSRDEVLSQLVQGLIERTGLLIPDGDHAYRFRHLTFQEYLAGRWLVDRADDPKAELRPHLADGHWREVILLAAGREASTSARHTRRFVEMLIELARERTELGVARYAIVARTLADVNRYGVKGLADVASTVLAEMAAIVDDERQLGDVEDRIAIAEALGWFGDPRLTEERRWVVVPAGTFRMGSEDDDDQGYGFERPAHDVTVPSFELQAWPVTVAEYARFVADRGYERAELWDGDAARPFMSEYASLKDWDQQLARPSNVPVVGVSWFEARVYCEWWSRNHPDERPLRLPTEAEWEYACRAGTRTRYWSGDEAEDLARVGWLSRNSGLRGALPSAAKPPSPWGLHDMHGNVYEWCEDEWHDSYEGAPVDGAAWLDSGSDARVLRGGSWGNPAGGCRSAYRLWLHGGARASFVGFRPARSVTQ